MAPRRSRYPRLPCTTVAAWKMRVCCSTTPVTTTDSGSWRRTALHSRQPAFLVMATHRFSSISLSRAALHGTCFATKTTSTGQLFAVSVAGLTGRNAQSCWTLHWLSALHGPLKRLAALTASTFVAQFRPETWSSVRASTDIVLHSHAHNALGGGDLSVASWTGSFTF